MNRDDIMERTSEEALTIKKAMYLFVKRVFDLFCSLVGMFFLLPLAITIKISYLLTGDFNSIFYTQDRIGKNGKIFKFYKFRTMIPNADEELERILKENKAMAKEYKENKKLKHDPRITKAGAILRRYSLDEIPQFINIFLGNMSLIGNRPYLVREKKDMGKYYEDIVKTKPGITGLWQVSGRSDLSFKRRLELEKEYSKKYSIRFDLMILYRTFRAVIKGDGAM